MGPTLTDQNKDTPQEPRLPTRARLDRGCVRDQSVMEGTPHDTADMFSHAGGAHGEGRTGGGWRVAARESAAHARWVPRCKALTERTPIAKRARLQSSTDTSAFAGTVERRERGGPWARPQLRKLLFVRALPKLLQSSKLASPAVGSAQQAPRLARHIGHPCPHPAPDVGADAPHARLVCPHR